MLKEAGVKKALIRIASSRDLTGLLAMYRTFEPKEEFQGLPPAQPERVRAWLREHFTERDYHLVVEVNGVIVGHAMLCVGPEPAEAELAIFVHQDYRAIGIGKQLLLATLHYGCKQLELDLVWLSVEGSNPRALHVFASAGFRALHDEIDPFDWELEMSRPSHCEACQGRRCALFGHAPPLEVRVGKRRRALA